MRERLDKNHLREGQLIVGGGEWTSQMKGNLKREESGEDLGTEDEIGDNRFRQDEWFGRAESHEGQANKKASKVDTDTKEPTGREVPESQQRRSWDGPVEQTSRPRRSRCMEPDKTWEVEPDRMRSASKAGGRVTRTSGKCRSRIDESTFYLDNDI